MSFTGFAFYIAVHWGFDKHLYLTRCLNAHRHNTYSMSNQSLFGHFCIARLLMKFSTVVGSHEYIKIKNKIKI